ncbi:MAG: non-ribosomal peptide synthetase, partial [Anaerolineales bacterium]|nr:non-ribosomal peptide synthetase [Anaerolineales bacterium]
KVDRQALPVPDSAGLVRGRAFTPPRTPIEALVADTWAQVLGLDQISVQDNFFEVGGHSLVATQVVSRLRDTFAIEFPLHQLFESPTVAGLAGFIESSRAVPDAPSLPTTITPAERNGPLPLSFAQQRLWFLDMLAPDSSFYNIPAAMYLRGSLSVTTVARSLNEIVRRHETLRTTFALVDDEPVQVIAPYRPRPLPVVDLQGLPPARRQAAAQQLVDEEAARPFVLSQGPLIRFAWLRIAPTEQVLLVNMHHIISDGWSVTLFERELDALYHAYEQGQPSPLPELPIQYADFALWQQQWLQGAGLAHQMQYWRTQLADLPTLALPTDYPRPPAQTFRGAAHSFVIPTETAAALRAVARAEGVTLFMLLLTAFQILLARYSGQEDVVVGTPIANRNRFETEGLIGFFVNTLVLRTDLSGHPSFRQLLRRVRAMTLAAYDHQDLPFEKLVQELQPERDLSRNPLFQVMFTFDLGYGNGGETRAEVTTDPVAVDLHVTKFDLTLAMGDDAGVLVGDIEYNIDLFAADTIARIAAHWQHLLTAIVEQPRAPFTQLPLLPPAETQQILFAWNE